MAESTYYLESIVPVLSKNKKVGIAFLIKKDNQYTYFLTCKHVVYSDGEFKMKMTLLNHIIFLLMKMILLLVKVKI